MLLLFSDFLQLAKIVKELECKKVKQLEAMKADILRRAKIFIRRTEGSTNFASLKGKKIKPVHNICRIIVGLWLFSFYWILVCSNRFDKHGCCMGGTTEGCHSV